ncbi:hypothetical protein [Fuerstiella marisgermanici]|uniref:Uncharacterized protein n=1 Tax=Fuerstiella marisgermanici TaxID=1891926 RepID=A0A1P8WRN0_9PLAN|nr:hypothetical protein [Fuerstiella marisgermanici]APZ96714.1 hypothetical protein Fuma_06387 [Fuerstiella marisgermanici]
MKSIAAMLLPLVLLSSSVVGQEASPPPPTGTLNEESLGQVLTAIGLKPVKTDKRYDFAFKTSVRGEEWKFSMSAVLSRNSESIWVMAWLDEVPSQSSQVPQLALLKLLAANDRMGNGKFFAYIPNNKRFVLQRVVKNQQMSTKLLMEALQDLAISVADEYPTWSVANWAPKSSTPQPKIARGKGDSVPNPTAGNRTSEAASKFEDRRVQ